MINVNICPIIVAIAAPFTLILNTNIKIGSNIILDIAPTIVAIIAYLGLPSFLIEAFKPCPIM